jgi:hypothetical protein
MKIYGGVEVQTHAILTSALDGGEWSDLPPGKEPPRYPLDRRLGGPQSRSGHGGEENKTLAKIKPKRRHKNLVVYYTEFYRNRSENL